METKKKYKLTDETIQVGDLTLHRNVPLYFTLKFFIIKSCQI